MCIPLWNDSTAIPKCICSSGYVLDSNNKCVIKMPSTFILLSKSRPFSIKGIDLETGNETMVPITKIGRPKALECDVETKSVFFADAHSLTVEMVPLNNTANHTVLLSNVLCEGLAFDWISRNLYWTSLEKGSISVVKLANVSISRTLIQSNSFSPSSIAVDPIRGVMFWADWSNMSPEKGRIDTAQMDGKKRRIFLNTNIHWPSGLAIDYQVKRLYWTDKHLRMIQSINYDGSDRKTETVSHVDPPISLAIGVGTHKHIYYIETTTGAVIAVSNSTGKRTLYQGSLPLYDVKLFDSEAQKGKHT